MAYKSLKIEIYRNLANIIMGACVLFAALAWRDAALTFVDENPQYKNTGPWGYAAFVTVIAIAAIVVVLVPLKMIDK